MTEPGRAELAPGYSIPQVINGCWQLTPDHGGGPANETDTLSRFSELVEHGFTAFDCADIYTGVEDLLGRFRASLPDPDLIQLHTKLVPDRATLGELTAARVDAVIDRSLRRLRTQRLDLVQCHWWDYAVPGLDLLAERLLRARDAGKVRLIGATNFDTEHLRYLIDGGLPLISVQAQYSLLDRRPERRMAALARDTGVQLLAYGALAGGFLGDAWLGREAPTEMNRSQAKYRLIIDEAGGWAACQGLLAGLAGIGARHGVSAAQVAVRWVLEQSMSAAVILGVGRHPRVTEHLSLFGWRLDASDQQDIGRLLGDLSIPAGDMYELERRGDSPHASLIRTDLQDVIA